MSRGPLSIGPLVLGGGGALLVLFLLVGWLLPQDWEAEASALIPATAAAVYPLLDSPEGWRQWTPWPESGVERSGPTRGEGATLSWDDPDLGAGSFAIVGATEPARVDYAVRVDDGAMRTDGTLSLTPEAGGVRIDWREEGDLGWNPLMGYWALSLSRAQSEELAKGLDRLRTLVADARSSVTPAPADGAPASR
jgi:hypothetical protein